ncbi:adenine phosphoribosyltransferase [Pseudoxanthomonas composti]|uniref:Adenine phosphoribosyltransferase n=1 Tax=Pseudoxanthomonas composti TaxID=2137479 RepID=A0A4Q1JY02_9GAMM|nr:adenine phosphoribosyltransferase [Pseudoxanthomonas composti]RXR07200.1 adenine phosphoribosyltransferase [Pseudoxanthomonas composti]
MCNTAPRRAWTDLVRDVPDFPKPGIRFKDITPALADPQGLAQVVEALIAPWHGAGVQAVVGIEARGFILGAAMAQALGAGFVAMRKPGKLPARTLSQSYGLEYGKDCLEVHEDALPAGTRVVIVDDVLATGGTLGAALALCARLRLDVQGIGVLIELEALAGRARLPAQVRIETALRV